MNAAALVDTNVLVYRFDPRFPAKQLRATEVLRRGIEDGSARLPHQALLEFVAATTKKTVPGTPLLTRAEAHREAEEFLACFPVLWPDVRLLRTALRGAAAYDLSWFDAHLWAFAERYSIGLLLSEDFEDGRLYGSVRVVNPFAGLPSE
jgi:predicted nucleic acid-binding protein